MCLSGTKDLVRVDRKWKMINIQVTLRLRKPTKEIQKISEIVRKDWRLSVRMIADMVGFNRETVRQTLPKKRPNLWKNKSGCCIMTIPQLTTPFCSRSFFPINHSNTWTSSIIADLAPCDIFLYTLKRWRQKGTATERPGSLWAIALLWTMEVTNAEVCRYGRWVHWSG